jgi:hypothetical protein
LRRPTRWNGCGGGRAWPEHQGNAKGMAYSVLEAASLHPAFGVKIARLRPDFVIMALSGFPLRLSVCPDPNRCFAD